MRANDTASSSVNFCRCALGNEPRLRPANLLNDLHLKASGINGMCDRDQVVGFAGMNSESKRRRT